jgi:hypothetical protein
MMHVDEQISQIYNFLLPLQSSITNNPSPVSNSPEPLLISTRSLPRPPSLSLTNTATPSEAGISSLKISPVFEPPLFYSDQNGKKPFFDTNQSLSIITDLHDVPLASRTDDLLLTSSSTHQSNDDESIALSIPPPPSIYNRSSGSSSVSLGMPSLPRGPVSNKIVPAPLSSTSTSPKQPISTTFRPVSNTRFNPGRSPKPKARSHQNRSNIKHQQQSEKSTTIELESPTEKDATNKNVPLLSTSASTTKSGSNLFRRFMTGGSNTEKTTMSSTLLYPPTSDDEHPLSPASSGNDDDDYRPLTSSSSKHHQTPL